MSVVSFALAVVFIITLERVAKNFARNVVTYSKYTDFGNPVMLYFCRIAIASLLPSASTPAMICDLTEIYEFNSEKELQQLRFNFVCSLINGRRRKKSFVKKDPYRSSLENITLTR